MANLKIGENDRLKLGTGDHFSVGSLDNEGEVSGEGTLGLDWNEPIEGDAASVTCPVIEENEPELEAKPIVSVRSVKITVKDVGAESYTAALNDGEPEEVPKDTLQKKFTGLAPRSSHLIHLTATNSRDASIYSTLNVTLAKMPMLYKVIQEIFVQKTNTRGQNCAFMARIVDAVTGEPLPPETVESITLNGYRLIKNTDGKGREPVEGFTGIPVELDSLYPDLIEEVIWTRDSGGFNFFHVPDQIAEYLLPVAGAYQVEYEIRLRNENPVKLCYEIFVY